VLEAHLLYGYYIDDSLAPPSWALSC